MKAGRCKTRSLRWVPEHQRSPLTPALLRGLNSYGSAALPCPLGRGSAGSGSLQRVSGRGWLSPPGAAAGCPASGHSALSQTLWRKIRAELSPGAGSSGFFSEKCGAPRRVSGHGCDELQRTLQTVKGGGCVFSKTWLSKSWDTTVGDLLIQNPVTLHE